MSRNLNDRIAKLSPEQRELFNQRLQAQITAKSQNFTIPKRDLNQPVPLSYPQQRLWVLQQLDPDSNAYNETRTWRLLGELNEQALETALGNIIQRHEVMRTIFVGQNTEPVQVILQDQPFNLPKKDLSDLSVTDRENSLFDQIHTLIKQPFDLAKTPPHRFVLFRLTAHEHVLLLVNHHIISDGWSSGVFYGELSTLYNALIEGKSVPLSPLPLQYADFASWQRQSMQSENLTTLLRYWQTKLANLPEALRLPFDFARTDQQNTPAATHVVILTAPLVQSLRELARQANATLYMTFLAAFQVLLMRYSRQTDIAVGSPIANRQRPEFEQMMGMFINTLVMRTDLSGNPTFGELLKRVRTTAIEAYQHQDMPFEKLVEVLNPIRHTNITPLFQVMLTLQNTPRSVFELSGLQLQRIKHSPESAKFDLALFLIESANQIEARLEFDTALFKPDTAARLMQHFIHLLENIVANPNEHIEQFAFLGADERQKLLVTWNQPTAIDPAFQAIHHMFETQAKRTPDAIAVSWQIGLSTHQLSYKHLNERANQLAHYLKQVGVKPETLVGICLKRTDDLLIALLGILKAGGAYVPLDSSWPRERLAFQLADTQMPLIVTQSELKPYLPITNAKLICLDDDCAEISRHAKNDLASLVTPQQLAYVIYTSGSTGQPKGVQIEHLSLSHFLYAVNRILALGQHDTLLAVTTLTFDIAGLELFLPLTVGAHIFIADEDTTHNAEKLRDTFNAIQPTVAQATPVTWQMLLEVGWQAPKSMKILVGGEALSRQLATTLALAHNPIWNLYGPTETTIWVTHQFVTTDLTSSTTVPIGRPLPGNQVYILDAHLQPVPIGVMGDLYIGGAQVARGYLNRPELTNARFIPNPFGTGRLYKTGDIATYWPDSTVEFLGRNDFQVKLRGFRIELGEVEFTLLQHPAVMQCVVLVKENAFDDKQLVAYLVLKPSQTATPEVLRQLLQQKLPAYMIPAFIIILDALPITPHSKVDHKALMARPITHLAAPPTHAVPTSRQAQVIEIWRNLLKLDQIEIHDHFFNLGGHSLLTVRLMSQIEQHFGVRLPLKQFIVNPTVANLVTALDKIMPTETISHRSPAIKKIIYDVGANNGSDIPYYLLKADVVVAIEANPDLCEIIRQRFSAEIQAGRLILENCVVTANENLSEVDFYIHKTYAGQSQFPPPSEATLPQFTKLKLPSKSILSLINTHGEPYYIKIDVEHYDAPLLNAIFASNLRPPFISAESHSIDVFVALVAQGRYKAFKLVDGPSVSRIYKNRVIKSQSTQEPIRYSFPFKSAGPFGDDIDGKWMTPDHLFSLLSSQGFGWKDIHATNTENPAPSSPQKIVNYLDRLINQEGRLAYNPTFENLAAALNEIPAKQALNKVESAAPLNNKDDFLADETFLRLYDEIGQTTVTQPTKPSPAYVGIFNQFLSPPLISCLRWVVSQPWAQQYFWLNETKLIRDFHAVIKTNVTLETMIKNSLFYEILEKRGFAKYSANITTASSSKNALAQIEGIEILDKAKAQGRGVILVGVHSRLTAWVSLRTLSQLAIGGLLGKLPGADAALENKRIALHARQLELAQQILQQGGVINLAPDGGEGGSAIQIFEFHDIQRGFQTGFAELALMTGACVIPVLGEMIPGKPVTLRLLPPLDVGDASMNHELRVSHIMSQYVARLDQLWRTMPWMVDFRIMKPYLSTWILGTDEKTITERAKAIYFSFPENKAPLADDLNYVNWLNEKVSDLQHHDPNKDQPPISNLVKYIYLHRPDLRRQYPDLLIKHRVAFTLWFITHAEKEYKVPHRFIEPIYNAFKKWGAGRWAEGNPHPAKLNLFMHIWHERPDLQRAFPTFASSENLSDLLPFILWFYQYVPIEYTFKPSFIVPLTAPFTQWATKPDEQMPPLTRFTAALWQSRADLQTAFPHPNQADAAAYQQWLAAQTNIPNPLLAT